MDIEKENGLIRAELAHNAYQLLEQYDSFAIPPTQRFDVTLHLCVLQLLLANSIELAIATSKALDKKQWLEPLEPSWSDCLPNPALLYKTRFLADRLIQLAS